MLLLIILWYLDLFVTGENDDEEQKSEEEEVEMEVENDRVPEGKWHPLLETRQRELGYRY